MYARVVRFTDVDAGFLDGGMKERIENDGPPEDVPTTGIQVLHDAEQGTAVVVQLFDTAEDMAAGEAVFSAMDPSDTPGTRASVDRCEIKVERRL